MPCRFHVALLAPLACAAALVAGCATTGNAPSSAAAGGNASAARLNAILAPTLDSPDSQLGRYVREVGRRLTTAAKAVRDDRSLAKRMPPFDDAALRDVEFRLADAPAPNAFTTGGGRVYATAGLLRACVTEDDFAAALAHAYAHLLCRHVPAFASTSAAPPDDVRLALDFAAFRYTPDQERQADAVAVVIFARAGWSPEGYAEMIGTLDAAAAATPARSGGRTSPATTPRLAEVRAALDTLPPASADWRQPPVADLKRYAAHQKLAAAAASVTSVTPGTDPALARRARLLVAALPNCESPEDTPDQLRARAALQPPPPLPPGTEDNPWGKGLPRPSAGSPSPPRDR